MKLDKIQELYQSRTSKASDVARQLGYAGIGVIWIFSRSSDGSTAIPESLELPLLLLSGGLLFDFLHYLLAGILWGRVHRRHEKTGIGRDQEVKVSRFINWPGNALAVLKNAAIIVGFVMLLLFLLQK